MSSAKKKDADETPWYLRVKSLLITAGSLAGAIVAIVGLVNVFAPKDVRDVASFDSIRVTGESTLHDFASGKLGKNLPLHSSQGSGDRVAPGGGSAAALVAPSVRGNPPGDEPDPAQTADTPGSTESPADPDTTTPSPGQPPTPTASSTAPTTPDAPQSESFARRVISRPLLQPFNLKPGDMGVFPVEITTSDPVSTETPSSGPISPERVADFLNEAFSQVEGTGPSGAEPTGWTVSMNVKLEGLAGQPMLLFWSLDGVDVPTSWSASRLAYRLLATTDDDQGSANIWVPDLKAPGRYSVNVELRYQSTGVVAARDGIEIEN